MLGPDAIEKAPYLPTGPVKPTQQSDRDKKQKFIDALKEELEDEEGEKRKDSPEDEVVLGEEPKDEFEAETKSGDVLPAEPATPPETEDGRTGETRQEETGQIGSPQPGHIDVKA